MMLYITNLSLNCLIGKSVISGEKIVTSSIYCALRVQQTKEICEVDHKTLRKNVQASRTFVVLEV